MSTGKMCGFCESCDAETGYCGYFKQYTTFDGPACSHFSPNIKGDYKEALDQLFIAVGTGLKLIVDLDAICGDGYFLYKGEIYKMDAGKLLADYGKKVENGGEE